MTENENKSKAPIVVGVCFTIAALAAVGLLILKKKYPWLKNTKVDNNVDNNDNIDDFVIDSSNETGAVEISDEERETEKEEKSSYEKIAEAVKPFCSPLVRNPKKKVVVIRKATYRNHDGEFNEPEPDDTEDIIVTDEQPSFVETSDRVMIEKLAEIVETNEKEAIEVADVEQADETENLTELADVSEPTDEETEQGEPESDFKATAEFMKEAEIVEEEKPAMVEPPAVEIPKFTEEQIKEANEFVAEMKKKEPAFNQIFMIPVSEETIEVYGFGVGAALLVNSGSDEKGDFTIRAIINRQAMPSEVKVYDNCEAEGFKVFTDMNAAREFATNIMTKATAINSAPKSFEESKRVLLQVLEEENKPVHP